MKRFATSLLCAALLCFSAAAFAQDPQPQPQDDIDMTAMPLPLIPNVGGDGNSIAAGPTVTIKNASSNGTGIPIWSYQVTSPVDGNSYSGIMVGRTPFNNAARSTFIPVVIIPVRVYIAATNRTFDPSSPDVPCLGAGNTAVSLTPPSPIFSNANWVMGGQNVGNTQYVDADQRASFWQLPAVGGTKLWHTTLGPVTIAPTQTVTAPTASQGTSFSFNGQCGGLPSAGAGTGPGANTNLGGRLGVFDINWWDPQAEAIIANLHIPATSFPLFLFYHAVMSSGPPASNLSNCCILGYHSDNDDTSPNLITTYGNADYERFNTLFSNTGDVSVMAHEVSEWMDDPLGTNPTPAWGHTGQVSGCQGNLETGDPLSGKLMAPVTMPNGVTYHVQELAFFSWFFRQSPSLGVNGLYSGNGTFTTGAGPICH